MKKVLVFCLALVMLLSVSVTAFAAGSFIESPSNNKAPEIVDSENESEDCTAKLVVTPYSERDKLDDEQRKNIEKAYEIISTTDDLTKLNDELEKIAKEKEIDGKDLAVSDLFNIGFTGCDDHDNHGDFKVKLNSETLDNFVALLGFDGNNWRVYKDVKVEKDGIVFLTDVPENFAIVVNTGAGSPPPTGDNSKIYLWIMIAAGSALAVVLLSLNKKRV